MLDFINLKKNNTSTNVDFRCFRNSYLTIYVIPVISFLGIVLNALTALTLKKLINYKKLNNGYMYKYLLIKSVYDTLQFVFQIFAPIYHCKECSVSYTFVAQLWFIVCFYYAEGVTQLASSLLELAATFDFYVHLKNKPIKFRLVYERKFFLLVSALTLAYSLTFYTMNFFEFKIVVYKSESSTNVFNETIVKNYHTIEYTRFFYSKLDKYLRFVHSFVRDFIILILLLLLNMLIVGSIGETVYHKRKVLLDERELTGKSLNSITLCKTERAWRKAKLMVISTGVVYFFGHLPLGIYHLPFGKKTARWNCYYVISWIPFYLSYASNFIVYITFNKIFRRIFLNKIFKNVPLFIRKKINFKFFKK